MARLRSERLQRSHHSADDGASETHVNLYQMVASLRPSRVTIVPGEEQPQTFDGVRFLQYALQHSYSEAVGTWNVSTLIRVLMIALLR